MASFLILDWDQEQLHVAAVQTARRGVQVTHAATWPLPEPLTAASGERVGKALREFLKAQKIAPAPAIVGLGRDRVFLKELKFPPIAAHEEANLVRFQTGKELAESVETYAVDYVHLANGDADRHIMTVAAKRDIIAAAANLCQGAGLKLHAVTPRLFGLALAADRAARPDPTPLAPKQLNVILSIGKRWAELCFYKGGRLLQAQALANGPLLANEIKRNLAVFEAQWSVHLDLETPECLYVFGGDDATLENIQMGQHLSLRKLDPLKDEPGLAPNPGLFAGAVGLALVWGQSDQKPVNLSSPKRGQAPGAAIKQRGALYGAAAAVVAVVLIGMMWYVLSVKKAEIERLGEAKGQFTKTWTDIGQERAELDAYKDWEQKTVPWTDELYDLAARFPIGENIKDFRINQFDATAAAATPGKKGPGTKAGYVAQITLNGVAPDTKLVDELQTQLSKDPHWRPEMGLLNKNKGWVNFQMKIDVAKQDAKKYDTVLVPAKRPTIMLPAPAPPPEKKTEEKKAVEPDPDDDGGEQ